MDGEKNCAHIGVYGYVHQHDKEDEPIPNVKIQVTGDKDKYKGPYIGKTDKDGNFTILISELKDNVDGVEFKAEVIGSNNVESKDKPKWEVSKDCEQDGAIQIMKIIWKRKNP